MMFALGSQMKVLQIRRAKLSPPKKFAVSFRQTCLC